jgi:UDP-2,4-diacetamido-2,4,6-trideoxy-beta-L-altropyranose hydrolase
VKIVFRTDASVQIGTGHVMRCLTLADALRLEGADCTFISRNHTGHLIEIIRQRGHHVVPLATPESLQANTSNDSLRHADWLGTDWMTDASDTQHAIGPHMVDWLVVDHYALDQQWERTMRSHCQRLMVIDDLADRVHECDLLLDQNLGRTDADYRRLTPSSATIFVGPRYALLRPEFSILRKESLVRRTRPQLKHLLITLGGVDKNNVTGRVLDALTHCELPSDLEISVVMGSRAPWLEKIKNSAVEMPCPTRILVNVENMSQLMTDSDLAICATGGTVWELCTLGLATCTLAIAKNQEAAAHALQTAGATQLLTLHRLQEGMIDAINLAKREDHLLKLQGNASRICDGLGAKRIAARLAHDEDQIYQPTNYVN